MKIFHGILTSVLVALCPLSSAVALETEFSSKIAVGSLLSWSFNQNATGRPDGHSMTLGIDSRNNTHWIRGLHTLDSESSIELKYTKTPTIAPFIKSADRFRWTFKYNREFRQPRWLGAYGQSVIQTSFLRGEDIRSEVVTYAIKERDGSVTNVLSNRLFLQDPFFPMNLRQSGGLSATQAWSSYLQFQALTGLAVREFFANGQRTLNDDSSTPEIEVQALQTAFEFGSLISLELKGTNEDQKLYYSLKAEAMTPLLASQSLDGRNRVQSTNIEIRAELGANIQSWLTLRYVLGAVRNPQVFDGQQLETGIEVKIGFDKIYTSKS